MSLGSLWLDGVSCTLIIWSYECRWKYFQTRRTTLVACLLWPARLSSSVFTLLCPHRCPTPGEHQVGIGLCMALSPESDNPVRPPHVQFNICRVGQPQDQKYLRKNHCICPENVQMILFLSLFPKKYSKTTTMDLALYIVLHIMNSPEKWCLEDGPRLYAQTVPFSVSDPETNLPWRQG